MASTRDEVSKCCCFCFPWEFVSRWGLAHGTIASSRVHLQKMGVMRPPAEVARYTMIFHKRDHGNEENEERWVRNRVPPSILLVCGQASGAKSFVLGQMGIFMSDCPYWGQEKHDFMLPAVQNSSSSASKFTSSGKRAQNTSPVHVSEDFSPLSSQDEASKSGI